jgi:hypothetical protein
MVTMKQRWKGKNFPQFVIQDGKISLNEEKEICMKIQFSPQSPVEYDVPLVEIIEYFVDKSIQLSINKKKQIGKIQINPENQLLFKRSDLSSILFSDLLADAIGKQIHIEGLQIIEEEQKIIPNTEYKIIINFPIEKK